MTKIKEAATEFLASKRIAVTGVSRTPQGHGSNVVYQRQRQRGDQVFAVNPNADEVEHDPCYHDLRSIPGGVDAVVIGTRPEAAESTMHECAELGIKHVWMHRSFGAVERLRDGHRLRPGAGYDGDRRRLPVHVRSNRRPREQGNARGVHHDQQSPPASLNRTTRPGERARPPHQPGRQAATGSSAVTMLQTTGRERTALARKALFAGTPGHDAGIGGDRLLRGIPVAAYSSLPPRPVVIDPRSGLGRLIGCGRVRERRVPGPRPQGLDLTRQRDQQGLVARGRAELHRQWRSGGVDTRGHGHRRPSREVPWEGEGAGVARGRPVVREPAPLGPRAGRHRRRREARGQHDVMAGEKRRQRVTPAPGVLQPDPPEPAQDPCSPKGATARNRNLSAKDAQLT